MINACYFAGCLILAAGALYMILAPCYEDGIFGKLFLGAIGFGAGAALFRAWYGQAWTPAPEAVLAIDGTALFLLRHLYRFRSYCASRRDAL